MKERNFIWTKDEHEGETCLVVWAGDAKHECAEKDGEDGLPSGRPLLCGKRQLTTSR